MVVLGDFLQCFNLNSSLSNMKSSFFSVFVDGFRGSIEVRVVLSQYFSLIFRFKSAIFVSTYVIFVSFSILFHGNSAFFMNFRGEGKYELVLSHNINSK
jgi:hypothetical protein